MHTSEGGWRKLCFLTTVVSSICDFTRNSKTMGLQQTFFISPQLSINTVLLPKKTMFPILKIQGDRVSFITLTELIIFSSKFGYICDKTQNFGKNHYGHKTKKIRHFLFVNEFERPTFFWKCQRILNNIYMWLVSGSAILYFFISKWLHV
jgi:hypothetical protein